MKVMSASYQKSESQVEEKRGEKKSRYMYSYIEEDATLIWLAVDDVFLLRRYIL